MIDCSIFGICKAPICPMDHSFNDAVWYAGEDICTSLKFRKEHWRIIQRRIKRLNERKPIEGMFNVPMINSIKVVRHPKGLTERQGIVSP